MQYKIQYGDTLSAIARRNNTTVEELARLNGISDPNRIITGDTITLPDVGTGVTGQAATTQNAVTGQNAADADLPEWLRNEPGWGSGAQGQTQAPVQLPTQQQTQGGGNTIPFPTAPQYNPTQFQAYDPNTNAAYLQAMQALQQAQQNMPTYQNSYEGQIQDIYNKIMNREDFSYDLTGDMMYQQYLDQAVRTGRLAMMDSMGQAAALTGGYGSSYSQSVGQQQYDAYLQSLNDVVPELYGMARDAYNEEGQELLNLYSLTTDRANEEYGRYRDQMSDWYNNLSFAAQQADTAYNRGADAYYRGIEFQQDAEQAAYQNQLALYENQMQQWQWQQEQEETAYNRQNDAYDRLVTLITSTGYTPSQAELDAAGMTANEAQSWQGYYQQSMAKKSSGGGGGGGSSSTSDAAYNILETMRSFGNDDQAMSYLISLDLPQNTFSRVWDMYMNPTGQPSADLIETMVGFGNDAKAYQYLVDQGYSEAQNDQFMEYYRSAKTDANREAARQNATPSYSSGDVEYWMQVFTNDQVYPDRMTETGKDKILRKLIELENRGTITSQMADTIALNLGIPVQRG